MRDGAHSKGLTGKVLSGKELWRWFWGASGLAPATGGTRHARLL